MPDLYAVIGNPISHSKSPLIHTAFAQQTNQSMQYDARLAPLDGFMLAVENFRQQGGKGLNVTVPFKLEAHHLSTHLTERAKIAQAVNTLKFENNGISGDNTDGAGLIRDIESNLGVSIAARRILLLGAGGAARGVILPLLQQNPALLAIVNRTPHKAEALQQQFTSHGPIVAGDLMGRCPIPRLVSRLIWVSRRGSDLSPLRLSPGSRCNRRLPGNRCSARPRAGPRGVSD